MAFAVLSVCAVLVALALLLVRPHKSSGLPPGPRPLPFIGNLLDLPPKGVPEFQHWLKHRTQYGPISSVSVMGITMIIIHDLPTARLLLDKKAARTTGRPVFKFAQTLCGFDEILALRQPDECYHRRRKLLHKGIGTKTDSDRYGHIMEAETRNFVLQMLDRPNNLVENLHSAAGAVMLKMTYGYNIDRMKTDPLVTVIEKMLVNFSAATVPLAWIVDAIPVLSYLPDWFPGTAFKRTAREWRDINFTVANVPYRFVQARMSSGCHQPSYTSDTIQMMCGAPHQSLVLEQEEDVKWSAASLYSGGTDTVVATLSNFFLAMIMFPDVQQKAQAEIDKVTGGSRLPGMEDRESLPYVFRVALETFRWNPIGPMGLAHVAEEDIALGEYTIPGGAYILPAVWWFCHDPTRYAQPDMFDPTRYFEPRSEPDPKSVAFGFGRRICPGRFFAESSVFLTIAQTLAVFNIRAGIEKDGAKSQARLQPMPGLISHPRKFKYEIVPRSERHADMIREVRANTIQKEADAVWLDAGIGH